MQGFQNRNTGGGDEDFPTPPWATRAFVRHILPDDLSGMTVWEPAANRGHMARPLSEFFGQVIASDKIDYGVGFPVIDFLNGPSPTDFGQKVDWVITNPPFNLALEFVKRAVDIADYGVAMFVRASWLEGKQRYEELFQPHPPAFVCPYVERVPIVRGRLDKKAATQMPYAWFVWVKDSKAPTRCLWIPPSRADMERDDDYDA